MEAAPVKRIPLEQVRPSKRFQPRKHFGEAGLEELAASIEKSGQAETAIVFAVEGAGEVRYELLAGERRWRALKRTSKKTIRAAVVQTNDPKILLQIATLSNADREGISDLDQFHHAVYLRDEEGLSISEIGTAFGKSVQWASNLLNLERLHGNLLKKLGNGISKSAAQELIRLEKQDQLVALRRMREEGGSGQKVARRVVEEMLEQGFGKNAEAQDRSTMTPTFRTNFAARCGEIAKDVRRLTTSRKAVIMRGASADDKRTMRESLAKIEKELEPLREALAA